MTDRLELTQLVMLSDEPTPDHNADGLQMRAYAEVIAGAALGTRGPFTIGVHGKWGEGKTSLLRQARSLIEHTQKGEAASAPAITVWFNAWQYDHEAYPLVPLALAIAQAVDTAIPEKDKYIKASRWITLREIAGALRAVAAGLTVKSPILEVSGKEILAELDRLSASDLGSSLGSSIYQKAFALLQQTSAVGLDGEGAARRPPIVVFIDDLDRCTPERALRLLQSVRLVLSQPGFLFVLALDRDPVVHYLAREYERLKMPEPASCARSYLDKMIQLPLWIPPHRGRFEGFMRTLLEREELKTHTELKTALESLVGLLQAGTEANPRAVVRLVNSLIADRQLWIARKKAVDVEWLGFCAISRILRDRLPEGTYHTLVRADEFCTWLVRTTSPDDLEMRRRTLTAQGSEELTLLAAEEREMLEAIAPSATIRALLDTAIGKKWLADHDGRRTIEGYLAAERREVAAPRGEGIESIERQIRRELGLEDEAPITDAYRRSVRSLSFFFEPVTDGDLAYVARLTSLTSLVLWSKQVTDAGLEHLKGLVSLTNLQLWETQATDAGLEHLKGLTSLTSLLLDGTQITDLGLEHLKGFTSLTSLVLNCTHVTNAGLEHLKGLTPLTSLIVGCPQVSDAGLEHLKGLTALTSLRLWGTHVTGAGFEHLKGLAALTSLDLSDTTVTDAGLEHLKGLMSLTSLDLSGTQVTDAGLEHLKEFTSLTSLDLEGTQVTDAGLEHLNGLALLTSLRLKKTQVTDAGLEHLKEFTSLTSLGLEGTQVTDAGLEHLKRFTSLTSLGLEGTQVTDAGLEHLKGLASLTSLTLGGTRVTDAGREGLTGTRPGLSIL